MDVTVSWWAVAVVLSLAACGFLAVCWVVSGWAEHLADWLRGRERQAGRLQRWVREWARELWLMYLIWRGKELAPLEELPPPLPPERTWQQMIGHELPGLSPREYKDWQQREGVRRRGAARMEADHRQHYAAMGMEYPSGLMARVREAAQ